MRGTAGRRKRGSWWGMQLRRAVPDMADRRGGSWVSLCGRKGRGRGLGRGGGGGWLLDVGSGGGGRGL